MSVVPAKTCSFVVFFVGDLLPLFDGDFFFVEFFVTKGDLLLLPLVVVFLAGDLLPLVVVFFVGDLPPGDLLLLVVVFFDGDLLRERVTNGVLDLFDKRPRGAGRVEFMSLLSALNKFVIIRARRYCMNYSDLVASGTGSV
jgi:hypothetical protein